MNTRKKLATPLGRELLVCFDFLDDFGRIADCDHVFRNVCRDDRTCSDDAVFADRDSAPNGHVSAESDAVFDHDRFGVAYFFHSEFFFFRAEFSEDACSRRNVDVVSDCDFRHVLKRNVMVQKHLIAKFDP